MSLSIGKAKTRLLTLLADKHDHWVMEAERLGAGDMAEDLVHDMYIRLADKIEDVSRIEFNENELNTYYVWLTLRSVVVDYQRKQRELPCDFNYIHNEDIDALDDMDVSGYFASENAFFQRLNVWSARLESNEQIISDILDEDVRHVVYHEMRSWHWYDKALFDLYFSTDMSYRKIEEETGISLTSIHTTIKNGKERIKAALKKSGVR